MASGSQVWRPNWADLPHEPINKKKQIREIKLHFVEKSTIWADSKKIANGKITLNSKDRNRKKIRAVAIKKPRSPMRLTSSAFKAALFACTLVFQKLIKR
jgi:hypothetical protein